MKTRRSWAVFLLGLKPDVNCGDAVGQIVELKKAHVGEADLQILDAVVRFRPAIVPLAFFTMVCVLAECHSPIG
jgi:hypothetical protein